MPNFNDVRVLFFLYFLHVELHLLQFGLKVRCSLPLWRARHSTRLSSVPLISIFDDDNDDVSDSIRF
jgi:hypothetical protein